MFQNYRIIVVIPAGRQKYLEISKKYLYRKMEEGILDELHLWQKYHQSARYRLSGEAAETLVGIYKIDEPITPRGQRLEFASNAQVYEIRARR